MCKLQKFLCCLSLETGGLIIGWFNLIISVLALIGFIILLSLTTVGYYHIEGGTSGVVGAFITLIIIYSLFIIYYIIAFLAALWLIQGTKRKDHTKMVLFMIIMLVGVILQFLQALTAGWATFISGMFFALLSLYWFLCVYSLYHKMKSIPSGQGFV